MVQLRYLAAALLLAVAFSPAALAADFGQTGLVDVYNALDVSQNTQLDFGAVSDNDGTITMDPDGTISSDANGIHVGVSSPAGGDFDITGQSGAVVSVTLNGSTASGLTIGNFTTNQADLNSVTLTGGTVNLLIGADLTVSAASAAPGNDQSLSYTIGVTYN